MREDAIKGRLDQSFSKGKTGIHQLERSSEKERVEDGKPNRRSVWTISTKPFKEAPFRGISAGLDRAVHSRRMPGRRYGPDPFAGAGTTGLVAQRMGRNPTLIELNPDYYIDKRLADDREASKPAALPLFSDAAD